MTTTRVRIGELRDRASHYVHRAAAGETIVVMNRDREVAVLQPPNAGARRSPTRLLGALAGSARVVSDLLRRRE